MFQGINNTTERTYFPKFGACLFDSPAARYQFPVRLSIVVSCVLFQSNRMTAEEIKDLLKAVDVDQDGTISYEEFIAATIVSVSPRPEFCFPVRGLAKRANCSERGT